MATGKKPNSTNKKSVNIFSDKDLQKKLYCEKKIIAQIFGLSVRRIEQLTQEGIIEIVETEVGKRYEMIPTISRFVKYQSEKLQNKGGSKREEDLKLQKLEAEIGLKEAQGELQRYKADIAQGRYIEVKVIKEDYDRFFAIFKKFALSLPSKITNKLNGSLDPLQIRGIEKEMKDEVVRQLSGFIVAATVDRGD